MKHIKMLLYGEPGVGKSVFASKAPKPFFITTDGNYEWLEEFGANPNAHKQVFSWSEAKEAMSQAYDDYDTIVVDLLEDMFKWCEAEFCTKSKIDHVSDIGYGKGYDITRSEFFLEISKLLARDKHIILITHGITFVTKDRRGVEHTKYAPTNRIPDKVMDMIEGRLRYCLRCYLKVEEQNDGTLIKKRYLSLIPKENEFGIIRGVDENKLPQDIPLDFDEFAKNIGLNNENSTRSVVKTVADTKTVVEDTKSVEVVEDTKSVEKVNQTQIEQQNTSMPSWEDTENNEAVKIKVEPVQETQTRPMSNADKIAAIKAKLKRVNAE